MSVIKEEWYFENDKLFKCTPVPELGENICRQQLVMTKEVFQECFNRWIIYKNKEQIS